MLNSRELVPADSSTPLDIIYMKNKTKKTSLGFLGILKAYLGILKSQENLKTLLLCKSSNFVTFKKTWKLVLLQSTQVNCWCAAPGHPTGFLAASQLGDQCLEAVGTDFRQQCPCGLVKEKL